MRIFITGATGFIGGRVAAKLRERGEDVVALVRSPARAGDLKAIGCELVSGDLSDIAAIEAGMAGCDAVIHGAAIYEVGITTAQRPAMYEANVTGTENVLGAALRAGIGRVVYVSTVAVFGNTRGEIADESYERAPGHVSYYEETKYLAHEVARRLIGEGLPCVIVQPGGVYGPHDHSSVGELIDQFLAGRLPALAFPELGLNMVHVDDVADGVLLALDKGEVGESYVLGGELTTMRGVFQALAKVSGRRPPRLVMPAAVIKAIAPLGPVIGPAMGMGKNIGELVASSDGVTWWARHDKAQRELGYDPRGLEQGLRDMLEATGRPVAA